MKVFNLITRINEEKISVQHISCNCKRKLTVQRVIQIKNRIMTHVNVHIKINIHAKKYYRWNPSTCICENGKYLNSIINESVIVCDEL